METLFSRTSRIALTAVAAIALTIGTVEARPGKGGSSGSRGSQTYSAPPTTQTAPTQAAPMQRSVTQPSQAQPGVGAAQAAQPSRGFGMGGMLGGLAAGFLGAGLFGMLFGNGFMSGMAGFAGFLGMMLQIGLVVVLGMLAWRWYQRRNQPAYAQATAGAGPNPTEQAGMARSALGGFGGGSRGPEPIQIGASDYESFEKLLAGINGAYDREDVGALRGMTTPEMASYFEEELDANARRGVRNRISDVKLLQGDLAEAWREGSTEYATVAMRFSLIDATVDRATGRVVEGDLAKPDEAVELWTFRRDDGGAWTLSAIQQTQ
jgi:predicted lipid-binding transport protein (Tim44 family)